MSEKSLAPSRGAYLKTIGSGLGFAVPVIGIAVFNSPQDSWSTVLITVGVLVLCLAGAALYFRNVSLTVGADRIERRNAFGAYKSWSIDSIGHILVIEQLVAPEQATVSAVVLLDRNGRRIIKRSSVTWDKSELLDFVARVPLRPEIITEPTTAKILRGRYPRGFSWWEANQWIGAWIVVAIILAIITPIAFAIVASRRGE